MRPNADTSHALTLSDSSSNQCRNVRDVQKKLLLYKQVIAASRSLGAKQFRITVMKYYSPPLSAILIVLGLVVFFTGQFYGLPISSL